MLQPVGQLRRAFGLRRRLPLSPHATSRHCPGQHHRQLPCQYAQIHAQQRCVSFRIPLTPPTASVRRGLSTQVPTTAGGEAGKKGAAMDEPDSWPVKYKVLGATVLAMFFPWLFDYVVRHDPETRYFIEEKLSARLIATLRRRQGGSFADEDPQQRAFVKCQKDLQARSVNARLVLRAGGLGGAEGAVGGGGGDGMEDLRQVEALPGSEAFEEVARKVLAQEQLLDGGQVVHNFIFDDSSSDGHNGDDDAEWESELYPELNPEHQRKGGEELQQQREKIKTPASFSAVEGKGREVEPTLSHIRQESLWTALAPQTQQQQQQQQEEEQQQQHQQQQWQQAGAASSSSSASLASKEQARLLVASLEERMASLEAEKRYSPRSMDDIDEEIEELRLRAKAIRKQHLGKRFFFF